MQEPTGIEDGIDKDGVADPGSSYVEGSRGGLSSSRTRAR
jgi:hypothetical protein